MFPFSIINIQLFTKNIFFIGEILNISDHNHEPDLHKVHFIKFNNKLKRKAIKCDDKPIQIISSVTSTVNKRVAAKLPSEQASTWTIQRARNDEQIHLPNLINNAEILIPNEYTETFRDDTFLQNDEGNNN